MSVSFPDAEHVNVILPLPEVLLVFKVIVANVPAPLPAPVVDEKNDPRMMICPWF